MSAAEHKAEALGALGEVELSYDEGVNGAARATIALTHATLALVEQQRIANLIAWATREGHKPNDSLKRQIDKALGL